MANVTTPETTTKPSARAGAPAAKTTYLPAEELRKIDAYFRAANYLGVGQIYLYDNPLLKEPLTKEHIKPRLLGHWGTTPGLNLIYAHLNRVIKKYDLDVIYVTGPGHGGPALVANVYLEGTYSEVYPNISQDEAGMKRLFTQFSFPGGIPSHVAPETPGSIHEGGELGYALSHHLGSGCSITAVANGSSIDTTMGFSPLEGVMMATRSGSVDPGLLLYLQARCGVGLEELREGLVNRSGLLGVSGVSGDLRRVLAAADENSPRARLAYDRFVWTLRRAVGAMAGVLGGVDALVFTGGIGENSARVRDDVSSALAFMGLRLQAGASGTGDRLISAPDSHVSVLVVEAREDLVILDGVLWLTGEP